MCCVPSLPLANCLQHESPLTSVVANVSIDERKASSVGISARGLWRGVWLFAIQRNWALHVSGDEMLQASCLDHHNAVDKAALLCGCL
jgi:hypothetical protein